MNTRPWLAKRFHTSYGIGWLAVGTLIGIGASTFISVPAPDWTIWFLFLLAAGLILQAKSTAYVLLFGVAIMIGVIRGADVRMNLIPLETTVGDQVQIRGTVLEDPQLSERGDTRVTLGSIQLFDSPVRGTVWVTFRGEETLRRGDSVTVRAEARDGFGPHSISLSYPNLLDRRKSQDLILELRDSFARSIRQNIVEPAASLGLGFVIGQRASLPASLDEQLRIVGLTHAVVASGYNLTILVRFAKRLLEKHSKYLTGILSSGLIVGFIAVSGASPSMIRAGIVTGLTLLAWYYGRSFHPLLLIVYVMALTAFYNPMFLWADIGWWLSFLAFAGVLMLAPLIGRIIHRQKQPNAFIQIAYETTAAQIMTLPLILLIFGQLPVLSVIANMAAAPFISLAMMLTFIAGVTGMILPSIASIVAIPAEIVLSYFVAMVDVLASPAWAQQSLEFSVYSLLGSFLVIAVLGLLMWRVTKYNFRDGSIID